MSGPAFAISEATIYTWRKQDRIDRGELDGLSTDQAIELEAARQRIRQPETELAVSRKVNEVVRHDELPAFAKAAGRRPARATPVGPRRQIDVR